MFIEIPHANGSRCFIVEDIKDISITHPSKQEGGKYRVTVLFNNNEPLHLHLDEGETAYKSFRELQKIVGFKIEEKEEVKVPAKGKKVGKKVAKPAKKAVKKVVKVKNIIKKTKKK